MKKAIIIFLISFCFNVRAQTNNVFFADTCYWYIYEEYPQPSGMAHRHIYQRIQKDTMYNGKIYQRVDRKYYTNTPFSPIDPSSFNFYGYYLHDSNRVFLGTHINSLQLVYDFNLAVGDSFLFQVYGSNSTIIPKYIHVLSVDSSLYGSSWRKKINFETIHGAYYPNSYINVSWVEGIGEPTYGPVATNPATYQALEAIGYIRLVCFTENFDPIIGTCNFVGVNEHYSERDDLIVGPQPSTDEIVIHSTQSLFKPEELPIFYDINGRKIELPIYYINSNAYKLSVGDLSAGVYIVSIKTANGLLRKKVIIE